MTPTPRLRQNNLLETESFSPFYLDVDIRKLVSKCPDYAGTAKLKAQFLVSIWTVFYDASFRIYSHSSLCMWLVTDAVGQSQFVTEQNVA